MRSGKDGCGSVNSDSDSEELSEKLDQRNWVWISDEAGISYVRPG